MGPPPPRARHPPPDSARAPPRPSRRSRTAPALPELERPHLGTARLRGRGARGRAATAAADSPRRWPPRSSGRETPISGQSSTQFLGVQVRTAGYAREPRLRAKLLPGLRADGAQPPPRSPALGAARIGSRRTITYTPGVVATPRISSISPGYLRGSRPEFEGAHPAAPARRRFPGGPRDLHGCSRLARSSRREKRG